MSHRDTSMTPRFNELTASAALHLRACIPKQNKWVMSHNTKDCKCAAARDVLFVCFCRVPSSQSMTPSPASSPTRSQPNHLKGNLTDCIIYALGWFHKELTAHTTWIYFVQTKDLTFHTAKDTASICVSLALKKL